MNTYIDEENNEYLLFENGEQITEHINLIEKKLLKAEKTRNVFVILTIVLATVLGFLIYSNFDYIAFKTMFTKTYIYQSSLQELVDWELDEENADIGKYFDDAVISVFIDKLYEISGDDYTYLYLPYQYIYSSERESARGASCRFAPYNCDTAYLNITNFTDESSEFVYDNVDKLTNYKNLILDLRNNPGGYVDSAEEIAEIFLDKDSIIYSEHTLNGTFDKTVKTKNDAMLRFDKIIILQNSETASAAEILIGALKGNLDNVILMGDTTFGKGIGQITIPLKNGFYLNATAFTWLMPDGKNIHGEGIDADYEYSVDELKRQLAN